MSITLLSGTRTRVDRSGTLLYDDDCGICLKVAGWLRKRAAATDLRLLGLARAAGDPRIGPLVEDRPLTQTIHFVRSDDRILTGARALLAAGRLVPRWRLLAIVIDHRAGHLIAEALYRQIAPRRREMGRLLGAPAVCVVPPVGREPNIS